MEANVLKAALSAAIRVTVSTSLLGCGGVTTGGQSGDGSVGSESPSKTSQGQGVGAQGSNYPSDGGGSSNGNGDGDGDVSGGYPASAGQSQAAAGSGVAIAGAPAGGEPGAGGAGSACDEAKACLADLEQRILEGGRPFPTNPESGACCQLLVLESNLNRLRPECAADLGAWDNPMLRPCCEILMYPQGTACTPWGPPVPPELELEQLLAWAAT